MHSTCLLCQHPRLKTRFHVNHYTIVRCQNCSFTFVAEQPSADTLAEYYKYRDGEIYDITYTDTSNTANVEYYYRQLSKLIRAQVTEGRILDIGCTQGDFLDQMTGYERHGVELFTPYAKKAMEKYGHNISNCSFEEYQTHKTFDVITLQDVLDHLPDPLSALEKCNRLLRPNGLIVVKVHNISCLFAKITRSKFYAVIPPEHLMYFNKKTLGHALVQSGYRVEKHMYLPHKISLKTIALRMAKKKEHSLFTPIYRMLDQTEFGKIVIRKHLHDIITTFARTIVN